MTVPDGGVFRSEVFTMESPLHFAGAWARPALSGTLPADSLTTRDECAVVPAREASVAFIGGAEGHLRRRKSWPWGHQNAEASDIVM